MTNWGTMYLRVKLMQKTFKHGITRMTKRVIWGVVC